MTEWFSYFINEVWMCSVANSWVVIFFFITLAKEMLTIYSEKAP